MVLIPSTFQATKEGLMRKTKRFVKEQVARRNGTEDLINYGVKKGVKIALDSVTPLCPSVYGVNPCQVTRGLAEKRIARAIMNRIHKFRRQRDQQKGIPDSQLATREPVGS